MLLLVEVVVALWVCVCVYAICVWGYMQRLEDNVNSYGTRATYLWLHDKLEMNRFLCKTSALKHWDVSPAPKLPFLFFSNIAVGTQDIGDDTLFHKGN